jgi:hypothetical protein
MRFGVFYEMQLPKPWGKDDERQLFHHALEQVVLADRLGFDFAWEVEHHFLDEYSHSSSPEVFLGCAAGLTKNIRLGHGTRTTTARPARPSASRRSILSPTGASTSASAKARRAWNSAASRFLPRKSERCRWRRASKSPT